MQPPGGAFRRLTLPGVKHLVAVTSGKGGVGKSTVATNMALALHIHGRRVGLMDADIYGPSIPIMMGVQHVDQRTTPFPIERYGLKLMSMGFVVDANQAAILRGPMIHKYLTAFLTQITWGELDFLLVDMPPGTGDAQLSLAQTAPLSGVVTVVTPQDVSLTVARRGIEMFRTVKVPIIGVVENMSYFTGDDGKRYEIFRHGGGRKLANDVGVPFLGEIPIDPHVAECGDAGEPIVHKYPDSAVAKSYLALANKVMEELQKTPPTPELPSLKI
jgi:ATP-binding protein involved in chromosome partitioning